MDTTRRTETLEVAPPDRATTVALVVAGLVAVWVVVVVAVGLVGADGAAQTLANLGVVVGGVGILGALGRAAWRGATGKN